MLPAADVPGSGAVLPATMMLVADPCGISCDDDSGFLGMPVAEERSGCTPGNMPHTCPIPGKVSAKAAVIPAWTPELQDAVIPAWAAA